MVMPATRIPSSKARRLHIAARQAAARQALLAEQAAAKAVAAEQVKKAHMAAKTTLDDTKRRLDGSAPANRNLLLVFYGLLTTSLMLCLGIGDEQLLLYTTPVSLPVVNVAVSIHAFASVAPLLVLLVHFDLLHNLNEHSHKLQAWLHAWNTAHSTPTQAERQLPAGALSDHLYPFVFDFAWLHGCRRGYNNLNSKILPGLCWAVYCWVPFTVLTVFFIRFADLQDYELTGWHGLLLLLDAAWLYWYWPRLPKQPPAMRASLPWLRRWLTLPMLLMLMSVLAGCWILWLFVEIQCYLERHCSPERVNMVIGWEENLNFSLVPRITVREFEPKPNRNHLDMLKLVYPDKSNAELWPKSRHLINLQNRRLGFADLRAAVMPRALLERANLSHANLQEANLSDASLEKAQLRNADLSNANLRSATLRDADLTQALLHSANLGGTLLHSARLVEASLQGANLFAAQLEQADLSGAQLQGAYLSEASLHGTNLGEAQLQLATLFLAELQGANLHRAQLQGADLYAADLQGASLAEAQLQGADLGKSTIAGSMIDDAALLGAILPDNAQLAATSGTPNWKPSNAAIADAHWVEVQPKNTYLRVRLVEVAQRLTSAKPQPLPTQHPAQFTKAWRNVWCKQPEIAKPMLPRVDGERLFGAITDMALHRVLKTNKDCNPYQTWITQTGIEQPITERNGTPK